MESLCNKAHRYTEHSRCKTNSTNKSKKKIPRLIGRYKIAFLFFLTRLILISCAITRQGDCLRRDKVNTAGFKVAKRERNAGNICKILEKSTNLLIPEGNYKMNKLSRLKPLCSVPMLNFKKLKNRNLYSLTFVNNFNSKRDNSGLKYTPNEEKREFEDSVKALENSFPGYQPGYSQMSAYTTYNGLTRGEEFNTFVSSHYRNMGEDIVEYLNRKKIEYNESPIKYTLKFCPFCPPHRFKSDNLFKHEIFKNSGNSYCHRCGYKGSLFDFKAHMGDLPGSFDMGAGPIGNPFGTRKTPKDPEATMEDVNKFEDNLFNKEEYKSIYEYLTKTRGIKEEVLRKYHVGAGTFKFKSITGKLEQEKCVVFPWLTTTSKKNEEMDMTNYGNEEVITDLDVEPNYLNEGERFDYNKESGKNKLQVKRIKIRSIYDKSKIKILPRGGAWGMFGEHLLEEALEKDSIVLAEGEFDAMSIFQKTGRIAISLPNGANSLPLALLPKLEKFNEIYLWMDFDAAGQSSISHFANKLGIQRTKVVHPLKVGTGTLEHTTGTPTRSPKGKSGSTSGQVGKGRGSTTSGTAPQTKEGTKSLKDANEIMLKGEVDMNKYFQAATVMSHSQILSFNDIRQLVYNELSDPISTCGIKSITMPGLSNLLKGHRRGELTVWTGSTGSGKTTLLSQLSLDYCLQGVSTLWGSFEINNVRLAKTMLRQFSGRNLENNLNEFDYYANKFNELPLRFLKFHGSTNIDIVLDAMDYAVYVYDVQHIIIDNLQFMLSNYSTPGGGYAGQSSIKDVYELQNRTIEKFRRFVTNKNVHLSLVVHPRKEADGIQLGLSSVFGSVKSTQEADNVIILQNILNESRCIDVKKNRFAGLLGRVYFKFDPVSLTAQEFKVTEYLNEYIRENSTKSAKGGSVVSKENQKGNGSVENKEKIIMSNYKIVAKQNAVSQVSAVPNYEKDMATTSSAGVPTSSTTSTSTPTTSTPPTTSTSNYAKVRTGSAMPIKVGEESSSAYELRPGPSVQEFESRESAEPSFLETLAKRNSVLTTTMSEEEQRHYNEFNENFVESNKELNFKNSNPSYGNSNGQSNAFNFYRDRERNKIGLVGIDLLNLKSVTQQINKMIQTNYSTTASNRKDEESGLKEEGENKENSVGENGSEMGSLNNEDNNNNNRKKSKSGAVESEEEEQIFMRGLKISKSSSIKEMRDFVKKNGLGELVKTAGKGVKKEGIYENIKAIIPKSAIVKEKGKLEEEEGKEMEKEGYPFGVSTTKSLIKSQEEKVAPNSKIKGFKSKYLSKLPKSLYTLKEAQELEREVKEEELEEGDKAEEVSTRVYYSENYDPLLIDGIIYVDSSKKMEELEPLFRNTKVVGVDIETTGLDHNKNKIRLIQLSTPNQPTVILDMFKIGKLKGMSQEEDNTDNDNNNSRNMENENERGQWLKRLLENKKVTKVFHNGKFDINFLRAYGFKFDGPIFDTMIASKLLVASRYISCKLTHVSERYLNIVLDKTQQYSDWSTLQLFEEQLLYSARDAYVLLPLYVILEHLLKINNLSVIAEVENKCILATSDMELNGIEVNKEKLALLQEELKKEHDRLSENLHNQLNQDEINLNSQKQLLEKLQELNIMDKSKKKLISDTSESTLIRNSGNPIISSLREYRKANKALTAFTQKLPNHINENTNRIYPNYNQLGAESGRFSCDGPNLQQVPREKKFRECFVASKGNKFVIADFSQIELRIAAEIANDSKMIQAYQQNVDLHSLTASILKNKNINDVTKEERQLAKAVNFGLIFGMSVNGLRMYAETNYDVKLSQKEAKEIYTSFFDNFKGILNWHNQVKETKPTMVRTLGNRLSVFDSFSFTRSLNYPVQGTSADITKETMARLVDLVKPLDAKIIICVHDEIILEVPERNAEKALEMLIDTMVKAGEKYLKKVPVEAMGSIGDSWADKS